MPTVTITIIDLPPGDERGNLQFTTNSEPPLTPEQLAGSEPATLAQQVGAQLNGAIHRMLATPVVPVGADVIEVRPNADGVLTEVPSPASSEATDSPAPATP